MLSTLLVATLCIVHVSSSVPHARQRFGHALLSQFSFPKEWTNLNHGSFGACPSAVKTARMNYQAQMDANPEAFFRVNMTGDGRTLYSDLIDRARKALAEYLNVEVDDLVLVDNASEGMNAVLRSIAPYLKGRTVLQLDTAYHMVTETLEYLGGQLPDQPPSTSLQLQTVTVNITELLPGISRRAIVARVKTALDMSLGSIGLCVFSHITSIPGLVLPLEELVELCHDKGALVLVDGAHAPGMIPLNLTAIGADFYVGNGHKWLFSPKGSAFLHAKRDVQKMLYGLVIDQGPGQTPFTKRFKWQGTRDPSAHIAISDALEWRARLGEKEIMSYIKSTAEEGARRLAALWGGVELIPLDAMERASMQAALVNIRVPCGSSAADGQREPPCPEDLTVQLVKHGQLYVPIGFFAGQGKGLWARISASVYIEVSDFELFGHLVLRILHNESESLTV